MVSVEQFRESGGKKRQVDKDLGQNGMGKQYRQWIQTILLGSLAIKRKGVIYWGI